MRTFSSKGKLPVKMWLQYLEDGAEEQAFNLAGLDFAFHHIAIMPDAHQGYGMPIGGVLATRGVVIPYGVGVDIGCGMIALRTDINRADLSVEQLKQIMGRIRESIPVGRNHHQETQDLRLMPVLEDFLSILEADKSVIDKQYQSATRQIGTLGGGNHFIELQADADGALWVMIHSGSRNLGKQVADHYNKLAVALNEKWRSSVPKAWQLAFLPLDSDEGRRYVAEMQYCVAFALANRKLMMERVCDSIYEVCGGTYPANVTKTINIAHNYATMENHYGENVMVHRKGATRAREGELGIIPGSQGTKSYIVRGKGNPESFQSCSHGAGRRLSRTKARDTLDLQAEIAMLDAQGIIHGIRSQAQLDEAAGAYKDISEVMANQADLVDIVTELTPLAVVKG